jgi:transcriptional regulator with XRE-family HTH domain
MSVTRIPTFPSTMQETFGARLRHQREKKGVSLRTIAQQTKIQQSLLEGLERDDLRHWPAGIFRRAYVREYAQAIGLDPDTVVREFVEQYPAPIEVPEPPPPVPSRFRSLVGSALGSLRPGASRAANVSDPEPDTPNPSYREPRTSNPSTLDPRTANPSNREPRTPDLLAAARICTELGRIEHTRQVPPLLREAAAILDAKGLIVWVWDALADELRPALVHGYPARMLSQLRGVKADADNLTAAAFRSAETCALEGGDHGSGALAVPLLTAAACAGVLAIELPHGSTQVPAVRAVATFLAAVLAQVIGASAAAVPIRPATPAPPLEAQSS